MDSGCKIPCSSACWTQDSAAACRHNSCPEKDSLRFYYLGKQYEKKVEHFGAKSTYLPEDPLIL